MYLQILQDTVLCRCVCLFFFRKFDFLDGWFRGTPHFRTPPYIIGHYIIFSIYHIWSQSLDFFPQVLGLSARLVVGNQDRLCIAQHDMALKEQGIRGLGSFLEKSQNLTILWSGRYFSRLTLGRKPWSHWVRSASYRYYDYCYYYYYCCYSYCCYSYNYCCCCCCCYYYIQIMYGISREIPSCISVMINNRVWLDVWGLPVFFEDRNIMEYLWISQLDDRLKHWGWTW